MSYLPLMNRTLRPGYNGYRFSDDDERFGLLPFLAGVAVTAPLWFRRPCCPPYYNYSYYNYGYGTPGFYGRPGYPYASPGYGTPYYGGYSSYGYGGYGYGY